MKFKKNYTKSFFSFFFVRLRNQENFFSKSGDFENLWSESQQKLIFCWFLKKNVIFHGRKSSILILFATRKTITKKNKWKNIQFVRKKTFEYFLLQVVVQLTNVTQNIIDLLRATQEYEDRFSCVALDKFPWSYLRGKRA